MLIIIPKYIIVPKMLKKGSILVMPDDKFVMVVDACPARINMAAAVK